MMFLSSFKNYKNACKIFFPSPFCNEFPLKNNIMVDTVYKLIYKEICYFNFIAFKEKWWGRQIQRKCTKLFFFHLMAIIINFHELKIFFQLVTKSNSIGSIKNLCLHLLKINEENFELMIKNIIYFRIKYS